MSLIFVYGTLKRGFPNFAPAMDRAVYVGGSKTVERLPLVIGGRWRSPYLIDEPGTGLQVLGELFEVDDALLLVLDRFENTHLPNGYRRVLLAVETADGETLEAWTYVRDRRHIEGIHTEALAEYPPDACYVVPADRPSVSVRMMWSRF